MPSLKEQNISDETPLSGGGGNQAKLKAAAMGKKSEVVSGVEKRLENLSFKFQTQNVRN